MKNILYIFADQWRKTAIGFEGEPCQTPCMDAFAKESMVFHNAISTYPLCSPHRGALITGKYPYSLGLWTNCKTGLDELVSLKPQEISIANVLKDYDYQTAYIGKWHLDISERNLKTESQTECTGWDASTPPGERRQGFDFWHSYGAMNNHLKPHYWSDSNEKIIKDKWSVEHETDVALDYMKGLDSDKPFCLFLSWNPPHPPFDKVPKEYVADLDTEKLSKNIPDKLLEDSEYLKGIHEYYGAVNGMDIQFKRIYDYLKTNNMLQDTIVVLSADHGEMLGSHGRSGKNIWFEESINIPFIIGGAGIKSGRSDSLISSIDQMPTLLDIVGAEIPKSVQGRSLKTVIEGEELSDDFDEAFIMMIPGMPNLIEPYREEGLNNKSFGWRGIRTKTHTYVVDNGLHPDEGQQRLLYDLLQDPLQKNPEFIDSSDIRAVEFDIRLKTYLEKTKDPFWLKRPRGGQDDKLQKPDYQRLQP